MSPNLTLSWLTAQLCECRVHGRQWELFTDNITISVVNVTTNRAQHDRYMLLIRGTLDYESRADIEKRKEEMERKSAVTVIKARPKMKGKKCMSVGGEHSGGGSEPEWSVMAVILMLSNKTIIFLLSFMQLNAVSMQSMQWLACLNKL